MRFIDWNGGGSLDAQDIGMSVSMEEPARREELSNESKEDDGLQAKPGCAAMAALSMVMALTALLVH